jgi:hypothetical protein
MNSDKKYQIKKLKVYICFYCIVVPIIGIIIGFGAGCLAFLATLKLLNHKQSVFLIIYFSIFGFVISLPIVFNQILITRAVMRTIESEDFNK